MLFTTDSDAPQSNRVAYIGTDNTAAGRQAGEQIKKALPNGGKVVMFVGTMDADNARERVQGINEVLNGTNITITDILTELEIAATIGLGSFCRNCPGGLAVRRFGGSWSIIQALGARCRGCPSLAFWLWRERIG